MLKSMGWGKINLTVPWRDWVVKLFQNDKFSIYQYKLLSFSGHFRGLKYSFTVHDIFFSSSSYENWMLLYFNKP